MLALAPLAEAMAELAPQNAQGEYYLPDLVGIYRRRGLGVSTLTVGSADEIRGVNSRRELAEVSRLVRNAKNEELMAAGVTLIDPATTYVEGDVQVGRRHGHAPQRLPRGAHRSSAWPAKSTPAAAWSTPPSATV